MTLKRIVRYPVKGLPGIDLAEVTLEPNRQLPGDRRFAFWRGEDVPPDGRSAHLRRQHFRQVAQEHRLAALRATAASPTKIVVAAPEGETVEADLSTWHDREKLGAWIGNYLGLDPLPMVEAVDAQGFTDVSDTTLSLINLNSVADLSERAKHQIEPERMRGNLYVEMPPWSELDLLGSTIEVGDVTFDVVRRVKRCIATEVNPDTGVRDVNVPQQLMKNFGHADCGIYIRTRSGGAIRLGDELRW
jgi:uncharacterized protein